MFDRAGILALSALALVLAAACGGGSGTTTTVRTTAPSSKPAVTPVSGLGEVDQLIADAVAGDKIQLAGLAGYQKLPCKADPAPGELAPKCRGTEADGTPVEVLPTSGCDRSLTRPESVPDIFHAAFPGTGTEVVAVYRPKPDPAEYGAGFGALQVIVMRTGQHSDGSPMGVALHVKEGRVVWVESDCDNLFTLMTPERVDSFIVAPAGSPAPSDTPTPSADAPGDQPTDAAP